MGKLTETLIQQWILDGKPIVGKSDGDRLTFTLSKAGTAAWTLRYSICGKPKELTLGRYPAMSLEAAREAAQIERARIALGHDVAAEKKSGRSIEEFVAKRIEALWRDVVKAESDLRRVEDAVKIAGARLDAARLALRIATEQGTR